MSRSSSTVRISSSTFEKLKSAASLEEMQAMITQLERPKTDPNELYEKLFEENARLENQNITRPEASTKYGVSPQAIYGWERRGLVRVIQKAKRRGMPTVINERDVATMVTLNNQARTKKEGPLPGWKPPIRAIQLAN